MSDAYGLHMNDEQNTTWAWLNDNYGVAHWYRNDTGQVIVECDDGDHATIELDGGWAWDR